ncbi:MULTISPECIES: TVP38/TMEM64 family protein [unclassified Paenibacillus]|uniref:TVP38/TMEM64 family protein n=1 Tax=unclassified Paenibacillus TaxID=185978 RepID=UPI0030F71DE4
MDWLLQKKRVSKVLLACVGLVTTIVFIRYLPQLLRLTMSLDGFRDYILSTGKLGPVMLVLFQILQTVIAPIPGEVVQIAGGYIYGTTLGAVFVTGGMLLGAMIAFYFTRFLGGSFIEGLLQREKFKWMRGMMDNNKFSVFLFIIFIIPGLPKDMFIYAAGLTTMKPLRFFMILLIARFPWLLASVSIGANIYHKNYGPTIVISAISVLAFIFGLIYKDKLIDKLSSFKGGKSGL